MKALLDTNILIYAYDPADLQYQERAIQILERLHLTGEGCLSAQCLAEFFSAVTRPYKGMPPRLDAAEALQATAYFSAHFEVFHLTQLVALEAGRGVRDHQLSNYDAQIWATARLNQIPVLLSEDFQHGQILEGVHFANPFAPDFDLATWK